MNLPILPALGVDELIQIAIFVIIVISAIAGQIISARNKDKGRAPMGRPQGQPPPGGRPPGDPAGMQNEIDAFLRRAGAKRPPGAQVEVEVIDPAPAQPAGQQGRRLAEPLPAELADAEQPLGRGVAKHVQQHIGGEHFHDTDRLGETIEQADDRLESRLHDVFDHRVGRLAETKPATELAPAALPSGPDAGGASDPQTEQAGRLPAAAILDVLRSPQSVRQAIILSEILRRPT
jgi:hypothetical protein